MDHSKLFLSSYPCALLCTSAAEQNQSDRCQCSTFQCSGSASWRCARNSGSSRPYGVCFSSPPPLYPLLHLFLQGCNLTHPHIHHVLWKATQKMRVFRPQQRAWWMDAAPLLRIKQSIFHRKGILKIHWILLVGVSKSSRLLQENSLFLGQMKLWFHTVLQNKVLNSLL